MSNIWLFVGDLEVALSDRGNLGASVYLPQGIWRCGVVQWSFAQGNMQNNYMNNWQGFADTMATSITLEV